MIRKLTREEAIALHMEMWKDMQVELGDNPGTKDRTKFKIKWIEEHFPYEYVRSQCFLCEYATRIWQVLLDTSCKCDHCPIAWNSDIHPDCIPGPFAALEGNQVDYRFSPISVILALPEREVSE